MKPWYAVVVVLCLASISGQGQQRYLFNQYTVHNGLSNNSVNDIVQDAQGFIWIATDDGLNRFDGHRFKVWHHDPLDSTTLGGNHVQALCIDAEGQLWCGGKYWKKISILNTVTASVSHINLPGDTEGYYIYQIFNDAQRKTWICTDKAVFVVEPGATVVNTVSGYASETGLLGDFTFMGNSMAPDPTGKGFWLATGAAINYYSYEQNQFLNANNNPHHQKLFNQFRARTLIQDHNGILWFNARIRDDIYWSWVGYDVQNDTVVFLQKNVPLDDTRQRHNFTNMHLSPLGQIWMGNTSRTPTIFNTETRQFDLSLAQLYPGSLTNHTLKAAHTDNKGNIWVGTEEGLFVSFDIYRHANVQWIGRIDEFKKPRIKCLYEAGEDSILIAANQSVYLWTKNSPDIQEFPLIVNGQSSDVKFIGYKSRDEVWVAGFFGLYSFNMKTKKFTDEVKKLPEDWHKQVMLNSNIKFVFTDEIGYTHLCLSLGYLIFCHEENMYQNLSLPVGSVNTANVMDVKPRKDGGLWLADSRWSRILYTTSLTDSLREWPLPKNLPGVPFTLAEDYAGDLWIGTVANGVIRLRKDYTFSHYNVSHGLKSNNVYKALIDVRGNILMITANGVARYNNTHDRFENIFSEFSLPEYSHRDVGMLDRKGNLWSYSQNILYSFSPERIPINDRDHPVTITAISVMDKVYSSADLIAPLNLTYNQNIIGFEFSVFNFNPNSKAAYQYMLAGLSSEWMDVNNDAEVTFSGLAPGRYIFKVRSDNGTGIFSDKYTEFAFRIMPPFYATWWFLSLLALAGIALTWYITRTYALARLRKREAEMEKARLVEAERLRIARDMHDDLGSGLSNIRMLSESAIKRPDENKIMEISATAEDLVTNMRQIIWTLNEEHGTVEDLCYYIAAHARDFLRKHHIDCTVSEIIHSEFRLTSNQRRNIFLTVKEALNNVVKHSAATGVFIGFELNEVHLKINVHDNGKGLPLQAGNRFGNGLRNMKQRISELGGNLEMINDNGLNVVITTRLD